jgi:hypothetical protein
MLPRFLCYSDALSIARQPLPSRDKLLQCTANFGEKWYFMPHLVGLWHDQTCYAQRIDTTCFEECWDRLGVLNRFVLNGCRLYK